MNFHVYTPIAWATSADEKDLLVSNIASSLLVMVKGSVSHQGRFRCIVARWLRRFRLDYVNPLVQHVPNESTIRRYAEILRE